MEKKQKNPIRALAFQITLSTALLPIPAILLAISAPINSRSAFDQSPLGGPTLGNYPDTTMPLSAGTMVTPDAPPTNTTSINVSTSPNFGGTLEANPTTGVARITNAHPACTHIITVKAFDSGDASATATFTHTVTTP